MDIKDITVVVDLGGDRPATGVAIDLAQKLGAHLTGLALAYDPVVPGYAVTPVPVDFMISARNQALDEAKNAQQAFTKLATEAGISSEARIIEVMSGGGLDGIVHDVRLADLVVISEDNPEQPEPVRDALIEAVLFHAGAPILITPRKLSGPVDTSHVLIAWDGSITAARAVRAAMPFLKAAEKVDIAIVDDGKELPTGQRVTAYLARHGITATPTTVPNPKKDVAAALKHYATESGAGLIVMGAYGHNRLLEWILGGATRGMLKDLTIPLIMTH
ncbi:universal stress protein [Kaistia dalseonensis]|uniref:Nucleotide-binding universal stress UspA family protein n=1 Tax=Kaistia dalseonensis TaxID=410840 RepID=A0ABU0H702_9HYPH|nr:universal stress protein [Kaistia dalseonensis]MCX5495493.1 universal stress protein [Kaistia dalseonensis]MDQ0438084.1 nucleotide-binding universal stress UspA family protein [Kaistia dalseonensis]